ncbi:MAG: aminotransferase class I/II-fold pyridoxal phosphate-dependent enzyme [Candidatus Hydrothermarchaeota archaeon]|nr:aminotransferase class I/II-fold pyridoxal phosphate-dependent enzyme [Candidatus Hydrothermarchaeota archaeon]
MKVSNRARSVPPSGIRKFFELVLGVEDVISLGVGEPDFVTPWHVREAAMYALEKGYTMYTSNYGLLELREEIARAVKRDYSIEYDPKSEILITVGVSEGFDLAARAVVNPGDEVIIPEPCYVAYKPCTIFAGGIPKVIATGVENEFKVTPEQIEKKINKRTKALVLNYPNNPTGAAMSKKELEGIADVVNEHDLIAISDEVYGKLTYDGRHTSFASLNGMQERTILLNGFSKAYAMTGWRVGYACGSEDVIEAMMKIHQYSMLCAPVASQFAAIEALRNGEKEMLAMVKQYNQRRRLVVKRLNEIGLTCFEPRGAFYTFPSIKKTGLSSEKFAEHLLKEEKVAVVPGNVFGESGEGFVRCSYAASLEDLNEALNRMERFIKRVSNDKNLYST